MVSEGSFQNEEPIFAAHMLMWHDVVPYTVPQEALGSECV